MQLAKFTPSGFSESELYRASHEGGEILIKVYIGNKPHARRSFEEKKLKFWHESGFKVPSVFDIEIEQLTKPYLVMEFIEGKTLSSLLLSDGKTVEEKTALLGEIIKDNASRHGMAVLKDNHLLIHTDPNTNNIMITENGFYYIDFEHVQKNRAVIYAAAKEVERFSRRVVRELGVENLDQVVRLFVQAYSSCPEVIHLVPEFILGRRFQMLHKMKEKIRKSKSRESVTRYDIAEAFKKTL